MATNRERRIEKVKKRIVPISEAEPNVKILVYGRHGAGKTRFAATAPKPLIIDINEKGTRSARNVKGADVLPISEFEDITFAYWYLKSGDHPYKSVVLDSITAMQHMCMKYTLGIAEDRDPNREPNMPDRRAWGKLAELMKEQLLNYRNLPLNVIFTALQRKAFDDDEDAMSVTVPDLSPGSRGIALASVDVIGHMYQKEMRVIDKTSKKEKKVWEQRMLVGPHEEYETKDRTGALGRIVRKPTMGQVIEAAFSSEEGE